MTYDGLNRLRAKSLFILAAVSAVLAVPARAAWLTDRPVTVTQPDGSKLEVLASGDEYFNWLHDAAGYVIKRNPETGWFVYTRQTADALPEPTNHVAGKVDPAGVGLQPGISIPMALVESRRAARQVSDTRTEGDPVPAPKTGTLNNIVIFIKFSGDANFTTSSTTYESRFNGAAPANSIKSYYLEASYNALTVNTSMYPAPSGTTVLAYEDSHPRAYYEVYDATTNPIGYKEGEQAAREHLLLKNAVDYARSAIESSGLNFDGDNDGNVDNVCFIVKGSTEGWSELLWPHAWALYSYDVRINGKRVWGYNFQLESWIEPGVLCHELGHTLGAPDLYHYQTTTPNYDPVGAWDVMCGTANPPQHMTAWLKYKYLKWIPSIPVATTSGTYTLNPITSPTNNCLKIVSPNSTSEFFVVEYRRKTGTFESSVPGSGLIVYRIKNGVSGNASAPPDELYIYRPNGTCTGGGGSPSSAHFSSAVGRTAINDATNPSSFLTTCAAGGLDISQVGTAGATISFTVTLPGPKPTKVDFLQQPGPTHTASPFSPQPRVQLLDPSGAVATSYSSPVTITVASGPGALTGTTTVNAVRGVATFSNLAVTAPGTYVLRASSTGLTSADSVPVTVTEPATYMVWSVEPTGAEVGDPLSPPPAVSLRDANGNLDVNATEPVTIGIASGPTDATINGTLLVYPTQGLATFSNLALSQPGTYVLKASCSGLPNANSAPFTVTQTATGLAIQREPSGAQEGLPFSVQPSVRAVDKGGRTVAGYTGTVTVALKPGTGQAGAVLGGTKTADFASGYANFSDLSLDKAGTGYVLTATSPGLTPAETAPFDVAGTPGLRIRQTSPSEVTVSLIPPGAPIVAATVYLRHVPAELTPVSVTAGAGWTVNSTAQTDDLFIVDLTNEAGQSGVGPVFSAAFSAQDGFSGRTSPITLTADSSTLDSDFGGANAVPATIAFIPNGRLAFSPISGAEPGATMPPFAVSMQDGTNTTIADFAGSIRVALKPGAGTAGALLLGTLMKDATAGSALFDNLSIDTAGTGYVLTATYDTWGAGESAPFTIGAAPLTMADAASALSFLAGLTDLPAAQLNRLNLDDTGDSAGKLDLLDAVRIARMAAGTD